MTSGNNNWHQIARSHLLQSAEVKCVAAEECSSDIVKAAQLVADCLSKSGKILLCGNGGSAADCQHISAEFTSVLNVEFNRPALAAIALTTDTSFITANANDFGFEGIFARQVEALGRAGDVLIGISTSGNSSNVLKAISRAKELGLKAIALTGTPGGQLANSANVAIRVPSSNTSYIQETHIAIGHAICALVERIVFGGRMRSS